MAKIIVTGGAGFIGSHLTEQLADAGNEVIVIDNFYNGNLKNFEMFRHPNRVQIHNFDVANFKNIRPLFNGVDSVYHLAGMADIVPSIQKPLNYFSANVDGTMKVMEAARDAGVRSVLYTASSSCYGIPDHYPTPENAEIRPQYPYALTKRLGEEIVLHWGKVYKMKVNSVRLFNVYGPRARTSGTYGAMFKVFMAQKLHGRPFTVVGDGRQTRDFTFVSDVVQAIITVAKSPYHGEVFNVGSGQTVSVNHIVDLLKGVTVHIPKRPGEPDCTFADISKIVAMTGWKPKVAIEEGVSKLLECIDDWADAPVWTPQSIGEATEDWFKNLSS